MPYIEPFLSAAEQPTDDRYARDEHDRLVHRCVWEAKHGPLPFGWDVHHVDRNVRNNALRNLVALPARVHRDIHEQEDRGDFRHTRADLMKVYRLCRRQYDRMLRAYRKAQQQMARLESEMRYFCVGDDQRRAERYNVDAPRQRTRPENV